MHLPRVLYNFIGWTCFAFFLGATCLAQTQSDQIANEIARLKQTLPELAESDAAAYRPLLLQAEQDLKADRALASLFRLQRIVPQLAALRYRATHKEIETRGLPALDATWQRLGPELTAREKRLAAMPDARTTLVTRALAEAALTRVKPLYQAARLYAREDTVGSGLYYLGQAAGYLDFALYCRRLTFSPTRPSWTPRSLAAELAELEKDILAAYGKADVAAQQSLYNQLNATLKTAQELNQERRYSGALFQYLEARRVLALLQAPAAPPELTELQSKSAAFQTQLAARNRDDSLARMYWEVAQSALASTTPDNLQQAALILNAVLPRYFKLIPE